MKIARLYEDKIMEIKQGEVKRPKDAKKGFGWYNYELQFGDIAMIVFNDQKVTETKVAKVEPVISLATVKANKIYDIKENTKEYVLNNIDVHKQINAALGIGTTQDIQEIKDFIIVYRNGANNLKVKVKACTTKEEVDAIANIFEVE